jgi:hypothetical protein
MAQPFKAARVGLGHLLDNTLEGGSCLPLVLASRFRRVVMNGSEWVTILGCLGVLFIPLGCFGVCSTLPCTRSPLGEKQTWFP